MIGKAIETIITESPEIVQMIGNRLYPISEYGKGTPAIYYIVEMIPYYTKNGQQMQDWRVMLITSAKSYKESWQLSMRVKEAFEQKQRREVDGIKFSKMQCSKIRDEYEFNINGFGQILEFDIKTQTLKAEEI